MKAYVPQFKLLFCLVTAFSFLTGTSQNINSYTPARSTGVVYNSVFSTASPVPAWRNTGPFSQDDNRSFPIPIGFDFWYDGVRYTELSVSTNGFVDFSSSTSNGTGAGAYGYQNSAYTGDGSGTWNALAVMYDDLTAQGGTDPLGNSIRYHLTGTAPNRIFTVEWVNMAVYLNTTPSLNFQVRIYEKTGVLEYNYGFMNQGTPNWSYTLGINAAVLNNNPTPAQLKCQQNANGNLFNNFQTNNLNPPPASNSRITFTPPVPANPTGSLTFSAVTNTSMTLNWTNWANNEIGYVIYVSLDDINYSFHAQTAANATNYTATGLSPSTLYYWRVAAVTAGAVSNFLTGSASTGVPGSKVSIASGNWNTNFIWSPSGAPTAGDNVIIGNNTTVTINVNNAACNNLTVANGGNATLLIGNNNASRTLTVGGNILVNPGGTFGANINSNITHNIYLKGNLTNNGTINFNPDANSFANIHFTGGLGSKNLTGTGTNRFSRLVVNLGATSDTLGFLPANFTSINGVLVLRRGIFDVRGSAALNLVAWDNGNMDTLYSGTQVLMNNASATLTCNNSLALLGNYYHNAGTTNIGTGLNHNLQTMGGIMSVSLGTVNVAGRYFGTGTNNISRFAISGGLFRVATVGSTSTTDAPFQITGVGSTFDMSGGNIVIVREGGTGAQDLGYTNTGSVTGSVTGGVLQIGDAGSPVGQTMRINSSFRVATLLINSINCTAQLFNSGLTVTNDVINNGGILNANNLSITLGGNWTSSGTFIPGTGTVLFNGTTGTQTITKSGGETFNHVFFLNGALKLLGSPITTNNLAINVGTTLDVSTSNHTVFVRGTWTNNGTFLERSGTVEFNGTSAQLLGGFTLTQFNNLTINNPTGVSLNANQNLAGTLSLNLGTFNTNGFVFTLLSTATRTARIGAITGGDITGDITVQRYVGPAPNDWRFLCSPVTGSNTLAAWSDNFTMSGFPGSQYPAFPFKSVWKYNEAVAGHKDSGFVAATNITNPIVHKDGYWCYIGPTPVTVDITGPAGKFIQTFNVVYTNTLSSDHDGWNMIGNPYPSTIDWDAPGWVKTNIDNEVSIWNPGMQTYAQYSNGVGVNGGSRYIPSSQAFWVHASGPNPVLTIQENCKAVNDPSFIRMSDQQFASIAPDMLRLRISGNNYSDETVVRFMSNATDTFDSQFDARKFYSFSPDPPQIATVFNGEDYAINCVPFPASSVKTIPLRAYVGQGFSGTYTISRDSLWNLPSSMCVILEDRYTGTLVNLNTTISYSVYFSDTTYAPRFFLHFGKSLAKNAFGETCPGSGNGMGIANGVGTGPFSYVWKNAQNQVVRSVNGIFGADTLFNATAGIYTIEVNGNTGLCNFITDTLFIPGPPAFSIVSVLGNPDCNQSSNGSITIACSGGTPPYSYLWSTGSTQQNCIGLSQGNYSVTLTDAQGCSTASGFVLNAAQNVVSSFTTSADTIPLNPSGLAQVLFSNYSSGFNQFQWNFGDGNFNTTNPNPVHNYQSAGTFQVALTVSYGNCADSAFRTIVVTGAPSSNGYSENPGGWVLGNMGDHKYLLKGPGGGKGKIALEILSPAGQKLLLENHPASTENILCDFSRYPAGAYLITLFDGEKQTRFRIIR